MIIKKRRKIARKSEINECTTEMVVMMFERLYLWFRGPCSLIQHNTTIGENLKLSSNIQIEISHNQLGGRHMEIHTPGFFDDSIPMELPHNANLVTEVCSKT